MADPRPLNPWRRTTRTAVAVGLALVPVLPEIANELGIATLPVVGGILAGAATLTRVLAIPRVEQFLTAYAPWLSAHPRDYEGND